MFCQEALVQLATTVPRYSFLLLIFSCLLALIGAVACGGDEESAGNTPAATTASSIGDDATDGPTQTLSNGGEPTDAGGTRGEACLLTNDEVSGAIGSAVEGTALVNNDLFLSCQYSADLSAGVNLTVTFGSSASEASDYLDPVRDDEPVLGLGDEAFWTTQPGNALNVRDGTRVFGLEFFGLAKDTSQDKAIELMEKAIERLPE
jgi:hypothetical protein